MRIIRLPRILAIEGRYRRLAEKLLQAQFPRIHTRQKLEEKNEGLKKVLASN